LIVLIPLNFEVANEVSAKISSEACYLALERILVKPIVRRDIFMTEKNDVFNRFLIPGMTNPKAGGFMGRTHAVTGIHGNKINPHVRLMVLIGKEDGMETRIGFTLSELKNGSRVFGPIGL